MLQPLNLVTSGVLSYVPVLFVCVCGRAGAQGSLRPPCTTTCYLPPARATHVAQWRAILARRLAVPFSPCGPCEHVVQHDGRREMILVRRCLGRSLLLTGAGARHENFSKSRARILSRRSPSWGWSGTPPCCCTFVGSYHCRRHGPGV